MRHFPLSAELNMIQLSNNVLYSKNGVILGKSRAMTLGAELITHKITIDCLFLKKPWLVEMSEGDDPVFTFSREGWQPWRALDFTELQKRLQASPHPFDGFVSSTMVDPWLVRERLFAIESPQEALAFFREFGLWRYSRGDGDESSVRFPVGWTANCEEEPLPISFNDLLYQRDFFERALSLGPSRWEQFIRAKESTGDIDSRGMGEGAYLFGGTMIGPKVNLTITSKTLYPQPMHGRLTLYEIQDAIRATVLLDWMEGREWPKCKECGKRFKRTSKHPMVYCSPRCSSRARQASLRRNRAKQKAGEV